MEIKKEDQVRLNLVYLHQAERFLDLSWLPGLEGVSDSVKVQAYEDVEFLIDLLQSLGIKWDSKTEAEL